MKIRFQIIIIIFIYILLFFSIFDLDNEQRSSALCKRCTLYILFAEQVEIRKIREISLVCVKNNRRWGFFLNTVELAYNVSAYNVNLHITSHVLLTNRYCYVLYRENIAYSVTHITSSCLATDEQKQCAEYRV